jgi:serine/threonine protein kinase
MRMGPYSPRQNDIWSLGVILVNIACSRNPWKVASPEDTAFRSFIDDPDFLLKILPISTEINDLLKRVFTLNPTCRPTIAELKSAVKKISTFTLTEEELIAKHKARAQARKKQIGSLPNRRDFITNDIWRTEIYEVPVEKVEIVQEKDASNGERPQSFSRRVAFPKGRALETFEPNPIFDTRPFTHFTPFNIPPMRPVEQVDPLAHVPRQMSRSSSSGSTASEGSLPATPEFPATDDAEIVPDTDEDGLDSIDLLGPPQTDFPSIAAKPGLPAQQKHLQHLDKQGDATHKAFLKDVVRKFKAL